MNKLKTVHLFVSIYLFFICAGLYKWNMPQMSGHKNCQKTFPSIYKNFVLPYILPDMSAHLG